VAPVSARHLFPEATRIAHGARRSGSPAGFLWPRGSFRVRTSSTTLRDQGVGAQTTKRGAGLLASAKHGSWMTLPMKQRHASVRPASASDPVQQKPRRV
jgi:hypothetical protein